jgi:hypothetical protein
LTHVVKQIAQLRNSGCSHCLHPHRGKGHRECCSQHIPHQRITRRMPWGGLTV